METTTEGHARKMSRDEIFELMEEDYEEMEKEAMEYLLSQKKRIDEKEAA